MPFLETIYRCAYALFFCCIITMHYSCDSNDPCGDGSPTNAYFDALSFRLVDAQNNTLIGSNGTVYENTDVTLLGPSETELASAIIDESGAVSFIPTETSDELNREYIKDFYLVLPPTPQMLQGDTDTINIEYKLRSTECQDALYDYLRVRYNDSLYHDARFLTPLEFLKE